MDKMDNFTIDVRNSMVYELSIKYHNKLLVNDKDEIIETYKSLEKIFSKLNSNLSNLSSIILYDNVKESLNNCKPLINTLEQRALNPIEKIQLSSNLASAFIGTALIKSARFSE